MNCACVPRVDGAVVTSRAVPGPGDHIEMLEKATNKDLLFPPGTDLIRSLECSRGLPLHVPGPLESVHVKVGDW